MAKTEIKNGIGPVAQRPADAFTALRDEMEKVFERYEHGWPRWPSLFRSAGGDILVPELDVHDNAKELVIEVELPGVDDKDVSVTLANGFLVIKGEKKSEREEKKDNYVLAERSYGAFQRSIRLPETIDELKLAAKFDKGVLRIVAAKRPEAVKAERRVEINKA